MRQEGREVRPGLWCDWVTQGHGDQAKSEDFIRRAVGATEGS